MRHILSASDFTKEDCDTLFEWADAFKDWPGEGQPPVKSFCKYPSVNGKLLGSLFFEPSTRTRWSTEAAMLRLGGQVLSMEYAKESSSDRKGETLRDTIKTCSQYVDILVVRHPAEGVIQKAAEFSDCPVINGGDGTNEHPTQALLDVYTITRNFKETKGLKIMFTGDSACSRTIHSLVKLLEPYEPEIIVADPNGNFDKPWGSTFFVYGNDVYERLPHIDVLYMTRHQNERLLPRKKSAFMMTNELACTMKINAIIMHPLPRTEELPVEIDVNPRAKYFEQAKNGMLVRLALLMTLLSS